LSRSILPRNPYLKEISDHGEPLGNVHSTYPVYFKPRRSFADGVLLVGDAARVNEPVSGEGIYYAMKGGQLAAATVDRAMCRGDWTATTLREYENDCRRVFRLRRGVNRLIQFLVYRPALVNPLIALSAKQDRLLGSLVRSICAPLPAKIRSHHEALEGHEG
jgi:flavin-dependent dehydrogenase